MESCKISDPASRVCTAMMRLGTHMASVFDREMSRHGLTQAQFRTLLELSEGEVSPSELARRAMLERATTSLLAQRMVEAGWLHREPGASRRTHNLSLTSAGGEVLQQAVPSAEELARRATGALDPDELAMLAGLLDKLEHHLRHDF